MLVAVAEDQDYEELGGSSVTYSLLKVFSFIIDKDTIISEYVRKNSCKNPSPFILIAYLIDIQLFIFMKGLFNPS